MTTIDTSSIDATKPIQGAATTQSVRDNFAEIITQLDNAGADIDTNFALIDVLNAKQTEKLSANRTYYVNATSGDDANDGLTSGAAFATLQKAANVAATINPGNYEVDISVAAGTYGQFRWEGFMQGGATGQKQLKVIGDATTPSNCVISTTSEDAVYMGLGAKCEMNGFKTVTATSGNHLFLHHPGTFLIIKNWDFGASAGAHMACSSGSAILIDGDLDITGGATYHHYCDNATIHYHPSYTTTLTGTPAFSVVFSGASHGGVVYAPSHTFSGAATGNRFLVNTQAVIEVGSGTINYFPGDAVGAVGVGGCYSYNNGDSYDTLGETNISGGLTVTQNATFGGSVYLDSDGDRYYVGAAQDGYFYHSGTNTYLGNTTGNLLISQYVTSGLLYLQTFDSADTAKNCLIAGGANPYIRLLYDGNQRLTTTSEGADIYRSGASTILDIASDLSANNDLVGQLRFVGENSTSAVTNYTRIHGKIIDNTSGSEDGSLVFSAIQAGTLTTALTLGGTTTAITGYHAGTECFHSAVGGLYFSGDTNFYISDTSGNPVFGFDANDYLIYNKTTNDLSAVIGATTKFTVTNDTTAGTTALYIYDADNATLERVTVGAADSGGAGYKVLRIPN